MLFRGPVSKNRTLWMKRDLGGPLPLETRPEVAEEGLEPRKSVAQGNQPKSGPPISGTVWCVREG